MSLIWLVYHGLADNLSSLSIQDQSGTSREQNFVYLKAFTVILYICCEFWDRGYVLADLLVSLDSLDWILAFWYKVDRDVWHHII